MPEFTYTIFFSKIEPIIRYFPVIFDVPFFFAFDYYFRSVIIFCCEIIFTERNLTSFEYIYYHRRSEKACKILNNRRVLYLSHPFGRKQKKSTTIILID